jgi:hypothetical protein
MRQLKTIEIVVDPEDASKVETGRLSGVLRREADGFVTAPIPPHPVLSLPESDKGESL